MPRIIVKRKVPLTPEQIRERATKYRVSRYGVWIDPFPEIPGTKPEKMVYAELVRRRIPFQFQEWFKVDIVGLESADWLRPDFVIPGAKIIIPVQGTYFHSKPEQVVKDSLQFSIYQMMGWQVVPMWEYDIETHLQDLFDRVPGLVSLQGTGGPLPHISKWYDDLKGLKKANQKKRKPYTHKPVTVKVGVKHKAAKGTQTKGIFG